MRRKTINERAADILRREYELPKDVHDDNTDHIRIGWFTQGYRRGFAAGKRSARASCEKQP